jgi:hypothetical protein
MRKGWLVTAGFALGLLAGACLTSHVWIRSAKHAGEAAREAFLMEQELLANRCAREGNSFRAAVHYLNVADAKGGIGFRWLERMAHKTYWERFTDPWLSYPAIGEAEEQMREPRLQHGMQKLEGLYWARAAVALERFGRPDLAQAPWAAATALDPTRSVEWHREFATMSGHGTEELERAYLDTHSFEELTEALDKGRRRLEERPPAD